MDDDDSGTCDQSECLAYFGGWRTRFTERIWWTPSEDNETAQIKGLEFRQFSIVIWSFCSLTYAQLGRMLWEVFDVDRKDVLERADLVAMYKFVYDCEEAEDKHIDEFPFDANSKILKDNFIEHCPKGRRYMIQPIIDYQKRVRRKVGGVSRWEQLSGFRRRFFQVYDAGVSKNMFPEHEKGTNCVNYVLHFFPNVLTAYFALITCSPPLWTQRR